MAWLEFCCRYMHPSVSPNTVYRRSFCRCVSVHFWAWGHEIHLFSTRMLSLGAFARWQSFLILVNTVCLLNLCLCCPERTGLIKCMWWTTPGMYKGVLTICLSSNALFVLWAWHAKDLIYRIILCSVMAIADNTWERGKSLHLAD